MANTTYGYVPRVQFALNTRCSKGVAGACDSAPGNELDANEHEDADDGGEDERGGRVAPQRPQAGEAQALERREAKDRPARGARTRAQA
eukprot:6175884-Pleurochrysis_carterae.AAC.2